MDALASGLGRDPAAHLSGEALEELDLSGCWALPAGWARHHTGRPAVEALQRRIK